MLNVMRRHATGWVVKVLFGLLIASFAIWGIGDVLRAPHAGAALAEVGGAAVGEREVMREFDGRLQQIQQRGGPALSRHEAVSYGLLNQSLDIVVARHMIDAHARDLSLAIPEAEVAQAIRGNRLFQGEQGFDRSRLDLYLRNLGVNEAGYVDLVRDDMVRSRIVDAMTEVVQPPQALAQRLLTFRDEQRRGRALIVQADQIEVPAPDDAALQTYLDANAKRYEAPEYRDVAVLFLSAENLARDITIDDTALRAEYDSRIADYRTPETRTFQQLLAPDEATAREALSLVNQGKSPAEAAEALKDRGVSLTDLGPLRHGDLPEALDAAVWSTAQGAVAEPVQTSFGWHVVKVTLIEPEKVRGFDEVKEELGTEMKRARAGEQLPGYSTKLDDAVGGGAPLEQAASDLGLDLLKAPMLDAKGRNEKQEAVAADRLTPEILEAVFAGNQGETSLLSETKDGTFFMFRIDGITPAHPRPLAEVREVAATDWRQDQQAQNAKARAEELRARITDAAGFEAAGSEPGVTLRDVGPLGRDDQGYLFGIQPEAVPLLFATEPGRIAKETAPALDGTAVLLLDEVIPPKPDPAAVDQAQSALGNELKADILAQYEAALRQRYPVDVNQDRMAALMEAQAQ